MQERRGASAVRGEGVDDQSSFVVSNSWRGGAERAATLETWPTGGVAPGEKEGGERWRERERSSGDSFSAGSSETHTKQREDPSAHWRRRTVRVTRHRGGERSRGVDDSLIFIWYVLSRFLFYKRAETTQQRTR